MADPMVSGQYTAPDPLIGKILPVKEATAVLPKPQDPSLHPGSEGYTPPVQGVGGGVQWFPSEEVTPLVPGGDGPGSDGLGVSLHITAPVATPPSLYVIPTKVEGRVAAIIPSVESTQPILIQEETIIPGALGGGSPPIVIPGRELPTSQVSSIMSGGLHISDVGSGLLVSQSPQGASILLGPSSSGPVEEGYAALDPIVREECERPGVKVTKVGYGIAPPGSTIYAVDQRTGEIFTSRVGDSIPVSALGTGYKFYSTSGKAEAAAVEHKPNTAVQNLASEFGLSYRSAKAELNSILSYVSRAVIGGKCGPWGITESQVSRVISYYEAEGDQSKADSLREHYATTGHAGGFAGRAEAVDFGPFGTLADYKEGDFYRLPDAIAEGVVKPEDLEPYFPRESIDYAIASAAIITSLKGTDFYNPATSEASLGPALAAGLIAEAQIGEVFGDKVRSEAVDYAAQFPGGIGAEVKGDISALIYWDPLGALWHKEIGKGEPLDDWVLRIQGVRGGDVVKRFTTQEEAGAYASQWKNVEGVGLDVEMGVGATVRGWGSQLLGVAQTPEFMIGTAGLTASMPAVSYGAGFVGSKLLQLTKWGVTPVKAGTTFGSRFIAHTGTAFKVGTTLGIWGTGVGATYGVLTGPPPVANLGVYGSIDPSSIGGISSQAEFDKYWTTEGSLREGVEIPEAIRAAAQAGLQPEISREIWERLPSSAQLYYTPSELRSMAYEPGIHGVMGRAGEFLGKPVPYIQGSLPVLGTLAAGAYQWSQPLSLVPDLWQDRGRLSYLATVPHVGPTVVAPILARAPPWQIAAGVGFFALPGLIGGFAPIVKGAFGRTVGRIGKPAEFGPFSKQQIAYGKGGEVLVDLGPQYGWVPYKTALGYLKADIAAAKVAVPAPISLGGRVTTAPPTPKPTLVQARLIKQGASWQWDTSHGTWRLGAPEGKVIVPEGGRGGKLVIRDIGTVTSAELSGRFTPVRAPSTPTTPASIVQTVEMPGGFFQQAAAHVSTFAKAAPRVIPAGAIAAMTILPGMVAPSFTMPDIGQDIQINLATAGQLLDQGLITRSQHTQLTQELQRAEEQQVTQDQLRQQLQQVTEDILTEDQQVQFQQVQQQLQQLQLQQEQIQQTPFERQTDYLQWVQQQMSVVQQQQQQQYQEEPYYDETLSSGFTPMPPILLPGMGGGVSLPWGPKKAGRRKGLLTGKGWIMPGLILHMPDPMGAGFQRKYQIAKPRYRKYGAKEPRMSLGGIRA